MGFNVSPCELGFLDGTKAHIQIIEILQLLAFKTFSLMKPKYTFVLFCRRKHTSFSKNGKKIHISNLVVVDFKNKVRVCVWPTLTSIHNLKFKDGIV